MAPLPVRGHGGRREDLPALQAAESVGLPVGRREVRVHPVQPRDRLEALRALCGVRQPHRRLVQLSVGGRRLPPHRAQANLADEPVGVEGALPDVGEERTQAALFQSAQAAEDAAYFLATGSMNNGWAGIAPTHGKHSSPGSKRYFYILH